MCSRRLRPQVALYNKINATNISCMETTILFHVSCDIFRLSHDPDKNCSFPIVLRQYALPTLKLLCYQTKNLSTDGTRLMKQNVFKKSLF